MIYYEVNLQINKEIFDDFMTWLNVHIKIMLSFAGFIDAKIYQQLDHNDETSQSIIVIYAVESKVALKNYFENHASEMREDAVKHFGGNFSATRRVFEPRD